MKKAIGLMMILSIILSTVKGNNVQLTDIFTNAPDGKVIIHFDLSWENSWRSSTIGNYDGVWIFFKFRDTDGVWKPLHFTGDNIITPAGYDLEVSDKPGSVNTGAFIYRHELGFGTVSLNNIRAGIESLPGTTEIKGFAIEMVYIPQGAFYVGDGTGYGSQTTSRSYADGGTNNPFRVIGNGSVTQLGNTPGKLGGLIEQSLSSFLTGFPTGYAAYWLMKYELSQGAYRDFLNTLTYRQQDSLVIEAPNAAAGTLIFQFRGRLEIATPGNPTTNTPAIFGCDFLNNNIYNEAGDGEWISQTYINWQVAAAYLDWAGLRPMTELEYEKSCRGPLTPVLNEFAWGTDQIKSGEEYIITNGGLQSEAVTNMSTIAGNALYNETSPDKHMRGGIFATATSTRVSAGAGYYGAMELTGSMTEYCVSTSSTAGRSYTGKHGDGNLNASGMADVDYWPGVNGNNNLANANSPYNGSLGVTQTAGMLHRGGHLLFNNDAQHTLTVSRRFSGLLLNSYGVGFGIRGVRDAN